MEDQTTCVITRSPGTWSATRRCARRSWRSPGSIPAPTGTSSSTRSTGRRGRSPVPHAAVRAPMACWRPPRWSTDPDFDLAWHVRRVDAPAARRWPVIDVARQRGDHRIRPRPPAVGVHAGRAPRRRPSGAGDEDPPLAHRRHRRDGAGAELFDLEPRPPSSDRCRTRPTGESTRLRPSCCATACVTTAQRSSTSPATGVRRLPAAIRAARHPLRTAAHRGRTAQSIGRTVAPFSDTMSPVMTERSLGRGLDMVTVVSTISSGPRRRRRHGERRLPRRHHRRAPPLPRTPRRESTICG